jgi:hypothetical protein
MRPADTSPEAWKFQMELLRDMPPSEKLRRSLELSEIVRRFAEAGIRQMHPEASEREVFLRMAEQSLGRELCQRVYGESAQ